MRCSLYAAACYVLIGVRCYVSVVCSLLFAGCCWLVTRCRMLCVMFGVVACCVRFKCVRLVCCCSLDDVRC